ncbi:MAG: hypothetical protein E6Q40_09640 [Cupriavidus sp.]|nr:MAG: hypothetical protein E6Q40_09640 [Cupriavidus sp.]
MKTDLEQKDAKDTKMEDEEIEVYEAIFQEAFEVAGEAGRSACELGKSDREQDETFLRAGARVLSQCAFRPDASGMRDRGVWAEWIPIGLCPKVEGLRVRLWSPDLGRELYGYWAAEEGASEPQLCLEESWSSSRILEGVTHYMLCADAPEKTRAEIPA